MPKIERDIIEFSIHKKQEFYGVWLAFIAVALLLALVIFCGLIPGINFIIMGQKANSVLEEYLIKPSLIPKDTSI